MVSRQGGGTVPKVRSAPRRKLRIPALRDADEAAGVEVFGIQVAQYRHRASPSGWVQVSLTQVQQIRGRMTGGTGRSCCDRAAAMPRAALQCQHFTAQGPRGSSPHKGQEFDQNPRESACKDAAQVARLRSADSIRTGKCPGHLRLRRGNCTIQRHRVWQWPMTCDFGRWKGGVRFPLQTSPSHFKLAPPGAMFA
ncbi:hypothetical protein Thiowin_01525 [Thiorhodovibrio winogradskyi]|uniref:Uncharacterized protein n=1 Tax=Thiorhodovibrio winogradskyi TaxID=77007 RepID=A0ABZ0S7R8_9GAMM